MNISTILWIVNRASVLYLTYPKCIYLVAFDYLDKQFKRPLKQQSFNSITKLLRICFKITKTCINL